MFVSHILTDFVLSFLQLSGWIFIYFAKSDFDTSVIFHDLTLDLFWKIHLFVCFFFAHSSCNSINSKTQQKVKKK